MGANFGQGFPGDEDNGEMSCWYLFSCLGFYPVCIGSGEYTIGSPAFSDITVNYGGKSLRVIANNNSDENVYIQSAKFNGKPYDSCVFTHEMIKDGGVFEFEMGPAPSDWAKDSAPTSLTVGDERAKPWVDKVCPKAKVVVTDELAPTAVDAFTVKTTNGAISATLDNNSKTEAVLDFADTVAVYSSPEAYKVEAITLTSPASEHTAIGAVEFFGADDNGTWQPLGAWSNIAFEWGHYTKPFIVKNPADYKHYKLVIKGAKSISEIELLGE